MSANVMVTISEIKFPIYFIIIIASIFLGMLYVYMSLKKKVQLDNKFYPYFLFNILLILFLGKTFTMLTSRSSNFLTIGFSSYGGAVGNILCALYFEKISDFKKYLIKYSIISLTLIYSLSKIACFIVGCCHGIPYEKMFSVIYTDKLNIAVFPIQLLETIVFVLIFLFCNKFQNRKNISLITIIMCATCKFLLDFLRYDHLNKVITINQIISLIVIIFSVILIIKNNNVNHKNDKEKT